MIFKFCFHNEIHRCTRPPVDFTALIPFLQSMFHANLPANFSVFYYDSNNNKIILSSQEDYELLLDSNQSGAIKLFVSDVDESPRMKEENMSDSEIIDKPEEKSEGSESEKIEKQDNSIDFEVLSAPLTPQENLSKEGSEDQQKELSFSDEEIMEERKENMEEPKGIEEPESPRKGDEVYENMISSTVESRIYDSVKSLNEVPEEQDARLREIVQETVKQQMPFIMGELEERLSRRGSIDKESQCNWNPNDVSMRSNVSCMKQPVRYVGEKTGFLEEIKAFGRNLATHLKELPDAAMEVLDDLSQIIEGDPNIPFAGRRYPRSVVEKAKKMNEIFDDTDIKVLLKYLMTLPRDYTLNQVIELYIRQMEKEEMKVKEEN